MASSNSLMMQDGAVGTSPQPRSNVRRTELKVDNIVSQSGSRPPSSETGTSSHSEELQDDGSKPSGLKETSSLLLKTRHNFQSISWMRIPR